MKSPCDAEQALAHTESFEYILFDEGFFEAGYIRKLSQSVTTTLATGWLRASSRIVSGCRKITKTES